MATQKDVNSFVGFFIKVGIGFMLLLMVLIGGCDSIYTVKSGYKGVVLTWGQVTNVVGDGLHLKIPIAQSIEKVDVRTQKAHSPADAGTKDLQRVATEVAVNYHIDAAQLKLIYQNYGIALESKIIDPRIQEVVKAVIAKYSAEQLLTMREDVKAEIAAGLKSSIGKYSIIVEDIQITNFAFSAAFNEAIEAKQTAEQSAMKARNDLDRIKVEAEQRIATATAEAEAIRIQASAIQAQGGKEYVNLKMVEAWNGVMPTTILGGGTNTLFSVK